MTDFEKLSFCIGGNLYGYVKDIKEEIQSILLFTKYINLIYPEKYGCINLWIGS